ncbi:hypothetical protein GCM10011309_25070 [Litorimonas cladophorae]|uniref:Uncharacterized protein n=1 Tax=Litorimonas cladophorae TaxID=1220491 RepID=A0A918NHP6_9PROT|nr:hypothetical protein GCM10011309_25070 [Litorimonas cladophorae]
MAASVMSFDIGSVSQAARPNAAMPRMRVVLENLVIIEMALTVDVVAPASRVCVFINYARVTQEDLDAV